MALEHSAFSFLSVFSCYFFFLNVLWSFSSELKHFNVFQGSETVLVLNFPNKIDAQVPSWFLMTAVCCSQVPRTLQGWGFHWRGVAWCSLQRKFQGMVAERSQTCWRWYPFSLCLNSFWSPSARGGFVWDLCSWKAKQQHCPKFPRSLNGSTVTGHGPRLFVLLLHSNSVFLIWKSCQKKKKGGET